MRDFARGLATRLPGGMRRAVGGLSAAPGTSDAILALALEPARLHAVTLSHGRSGWSRSATGDWPVIIPAVAAVTAAPADPAAGSAPAEDPALASLTEAFAAASAAGRTDAVVLGLPTSMLLLRILRLPVLAREEMEGAVALQMDKLSPFPGDELTIGWEVLAEEGDNATVFAAAAPERHMETLGTALQRAGVRLMRADVALLDAWRALREQGVLAAGPGRQIVLVACGVEWDLLVLDDGLPALARGLGRPVEDGDLARELTFSLFQAEMECGARPLHEILALSAEPPPAAVLGAIRAAFPQPVRCVAPVAQATVADGLGLRQVEGATLDLTPSAWRARERAQVVRHRLVLGLGAAAGLWVALAGMLLLGAFVTGQLTKWQRGREAEITAEYRRVYDTRERIYLIRRYMDRGRSVLEALHTITAQQPEGLELSSLTYRREEGCKLAGEAPDPALIYTFKERLQATAPFTACKLGGVSIVPGSQRQRFEMDAQFGEGAP